MAKSKSEPKGKFDNWDQAAADAVLKHGRGEISEKDCDRVLKQRDERKAK